MGKPTKEVEEKQESVAVIEPVKMKKFLCVNKKMKHMIERMQRGELIGELKTSPSHTIEAAEYTVNTKEKSGKPLRTEMHYYEFIDGPIGNREPGENVIGTLRPIKDWEVSEITK